MALQFRRLMRDPHLAQIIRRGHQLQLKRAQLAAHQP